MRKITKPLKDSSPRQELKKGQKVRMDSLKGTVVQAGEQQSIVRWEGGRDEQVIVNTWVTIDG